MIPALDTMMVGSPSCRAVVSELLEHRNERGAARHDGSLELRPLRLWRSRYHSGRSAHSLRVGHVQLPLSPHTN